MAIGIHGFGKKITASVIPQRIKLNEGAEQYYANTVSIYNAGSTDIYALVNCTAAKFLSLSASAVPIVPSASFSFAGSGRPPISSIVVATSAGTSDVVIGAL